MNLQSSVLPAYMIPPQFPRPTMIIQPSNPASSTPLETHLQSAQYSPTASTYQPLIHASPSRYRGNKPPARYGQPWSGYRHFYVKRAFNGMHSPNFQHSYAIADRRTRFIEPNSRHLGVTTFAHDGLLGFTVDWELTRAVAIVTPPPTPPSRVPTTSSTPIANITLPSEPLYTAGTTANHNTSSALVVKRDAPTPPQPTTLVNPSASHNIKCNTSSLNLVGVISHPHNLSFSRCRPILASRIRCPSGTILSQGYLRPSRAQAGGGGGSGGLVELER